jgi:hypothetical protein
MLEIQCPSCNRALSMPEEMVGKQVRCPLCSHVFQVAGQGAPAPQPSSGPPPGGPYDYERPAPRPRPSDRAPDYDDYRGGRDDSYSPHAAGVRNGAAIWLLISGILDLLVLFAFYVFVFTVERRPPPPEAFIAITLFAVVLYVVPLVFVFIAAAVVRNARGSGMVITGSVMTFVIAFELLFLVGILGIGMIVTLGRRHERLPPAVPVLVLLGLAALVVSVIAGIRALMAISTPSPRRRDDYY